MKRTPQGGIRADANLTRVGVFTYHNVDGTKTRELRHPDDIFKADALETLKSAPLTVGHPGMVTPKNYRGVTVGTVGPDVRADGKFVRATIFVQDAETCERVELGVREPNHPNALVELSCGYDVNVEPASGDFDGETYDSKQVGHIYNHVALLPAHAGRAGSEVRLRLDADDTYALVLDEHGNQVARVVRADSYAPGMLTPEEIAAQKATQARLDATTGERDALKGTLDAVTAERDALKGELVGAKALTSKLIDPSKLDALVASRVQLEGSARAILGGAEKFDGKSDRDVMCAALTKSDPKFDAKDRSDDYLRARLDAAAEHATKSDAAISKVGETITTTTTKVVENGGTATKSKLDEANEKFAAEREKQTQGGAPEGALVRKS